MITRDSTGAGNRLTALLLFALAGAIFVAYFPALSGGFLWDDDAYIENNVPLRTFGGLFRIWFEPLSIPQYYPLTHTTFWIEHQVFGPNPLVFHVVNVLLHITSTVLLFFVLRRLRVAGAIVAATVFGLHPVMVESVAWITERKNTLSMVFYLASAYAYFGFAGFDRAREAGQRRDWWWAFAWFACALASKSVTFSLPFTILLVVWWKQGRIGWQDVRPLLPWIALGVVYGFATAWIEKSHVLASGPEWKKSLAERLLIATRVPWFYFGKLLAPVELVFIYPKWQVDASVLWQWAFPVATAAAIALLVWCARRSRAPLAAALMFGGTLFPALGFVDVYPFRYSYVADHFQYHASLGVIVLLSAAAARYVPRAIGWPLALVVAALLGWKTWSQCHVYESREVLYESILEADPQSAFAYNNLAQIYAYRGDEQEALDYYRRCKEINPYIGPGPSVEPEAFANCMLGVGLGTAHSLGPAIAALRAGKREEAWRLRAERDPWFEKVVRYFDRAIELCPTYDEAMGDCAKAYSMWAVLTQDHALAQERWRGAIRAVEAAKRVTPGRRDIWLTLQQMHLELANRLAAGGDDAAAARHRAIAQELQASAPPETSR